MATISCFLDYDLLSFGIERYIPLDHEVIVHYLCVGRSGSGKSMAALVLLKSIVESMPTARLCICDFKRSLLFSNLFERNGYFGHLNVLQGIDAVYSEFQLRLKLGDEHRNNQKLFLFIDEYAVLVSFLPRPTREDYMNKIGQILCAGREVGVYIVLAVQKALQNLFSSGGREQFGCTIMMGTLSREQRYMLVPTEYHDHMTTPNERAAGYLYLDSGKIYRIKTPFLNDTDMESLRRTIADKLWVPPAPDDGSAGED